MDSKSSSLRNKPTLKPRRTSNGKGSWGEPSDGKTAEWYLSIASLHAILKHDECVELFKIYALGGPESVKAAKKIANSNLRLVASVARSYSQLGVDREDILQEGNMGLLHAIEKYDYTTGNKFSTYALWWIRQRISHFIATQRQSIRLPAHAMRLRKRIKQATTEFQELHGRSPSNDELVLATGSSEDIVKAAIFGSKRVQSLDTAIPSHDSSNHGGKDITICDLLPSNFLDQDTNSQYEELGRHAIQAYELLNEKDRCIIDRTLFNRNRNLDELPEEDPTTRIEFKRATSRLIRGMARISKRPISKARSIELTRTEYLTGLEDVLWRALQSEFHAELKKKELELSL